MTMINCRICINWVDETFEQIEADHDAHPHIFMGCRIFGYIEGNDALENCSRYVASENTFTMCNSCHAMVPKLCVSLGECTNCTDTDLFCVDRCMGGENRKSCTHFVRLYTEGIHLIDKNQVFDLFPAIGMPGQEKIPISNPPSNEIEKPKLAREPKSYKQANSPGRMTRKQ